MAQNLHGSGKEFGLPENTYPQRRTEFGLLADLFEFAGVVVKDALNQFQQGRWASFNSRQLALVSDKLFRRITNSITILNAYGLLEEVTTILAAIRQFIRGHVTPRLLIVLDNATGFFLEASLHLRSLYQENAELPASNEI